MFAKSIFLLFLITIISNQIDCFYYGDGDKSALDLQAADLLRSELDAKVSFNFFDCLMVIIMNLQPTRISIRITIGNL